MQSPHTLYAPVPGPHLPDWLDIMVHPRSAIQRILGTRSLLSAVVLIMLSTLAAVSVQVIAGYRSFPVDLYSFGIVPRTLLWIIPISLVVAPIGLVLSAFLYVVIGQLLGGSGDTSSMMMALSWSNVPYIGAQTLLLVVTGMGIWLESAGRSSFGSFLWIPTMLAYAAALYTFILIMITMAEVHQFSVGRALLTYFLIPLIAGAVGLACILVSSLGS